MTGAHLLPTLVDDLADESADLDARVAPLDDAAWLTPTPAAGWDIRDTINHLRFFDRDALRALDPGIRVLWFGPPMSPASFVTARLRETWAHGEQWAWGPEDADDAIKGSALDFCLLVAQRRHWDDLALEVTGPAAEKWAGIAQAFAGPPGGGREPLRRSTR